MKKTKHFFSFYFFALVFLGQIFSTTGSKNVTVPGDIMIGGLFPIHESVKMIIGEDGRETRTCDRFSNARLVQSLIMVHAVEEVNKRHELGNLTLGLLILDSCGDVTTALNQIPYFMKRNLDGPDRSSPPVLAVVGEYYSEISISVTRQLNLEYIPQISYGSTAGILSDKIRFPSFMRTVPEDDHQARVIMEIVEKNQWTWVGVVITDSDAGRYARDRLQHYAKDKDICFAFVSVLPEVLSDSELKDSINATIEDITKNEKVKVIVSFAKTDHMMYLFDNLLKDSRGREKVWVASDNWSESPNVLGNWTLSDVGIIFGTTLKSGKTNNFEQYLSNLDVNPDHNKNNPFLYDFLKNQQQGQKASSSHVELRAIEVLKQMIYPHAVFSVELAVRAIAQAVADLCVNRDCKTKRLKPLELREALKRATFHMDGRNYTFNERGDLNSGYEVILWRSQSTSVDVHYIVATYDIENKTFTFISPKTRQDFQNVTRNVTSRCSDTCKVGYVKKSSDHQPVCCYECNPCPEDSFSNTTDSTQCHECNNVTHYSAEGSQNCTPKKPVFLNWSDEYHIVLLTVTALGALLTLIVGIIFLARWNTPVVRASVGPICILLLLSLLSTFVSVILFGGKPNHWQCQARQVLFGLSFTLCVSCIMVKSFKIILAFEFDPNTKRILKKLYQPYIIIAVCLSGQVIICAVWLALKPPTPQWKQTNNKKMRLHLCDETFFPAFGAMLGYIGVLAFICLGVAFKGRNLPHSYNDARFITFSMLIYFISWIIFGPVYVNVEGKYHPAVEMVVILLSAYGILFCQFLTKCYIILFKQEANTESAFRQEIRNYSLGDNLNSSSGNLVSSSFSSEGIQNPAVDVELPMSNPLSSDPLNSSMGSGLSSVSSSPVSNSQFSKLQNDHSSNKRQLRKYLSLQTQHHSDSQ
ncbi:G-protein coupled receptor family C group 6 member A-like [Thunnus maccoyii]|uniref:G-protein coupled receptor family C group 6 member A-like n=1 Tax=Thunnus maccoyii TaxID=8240 RepID=UPI001C4BB3F4|nr:G-protein coupled receptor family C group 6 member A-like [Thunnus maccoyii]